MLYKIPPQESVSQLVNLYNQGQMEAVIEQAEALTAQYPGAYRCLEYSGCIKGSDRNA